MKKILVPIIALLFMVGIANAKQLYEFASFSERAEVAAEIGLVASPEVYRGSLDVNLELLEFYEETEEIEFGETLPFAGSTYNLAGSGITGSVTSITLKSLTITQTGQAIQDSDLSDVFYITIDPGNRTRQEIVSCTTLVQNSDDTATLSGCLRGIEPITPFTASTTLQFPHAGSANVIFSDPPSLFNEFAKKQNTETIVGKWTFDIHPEATSTLAAPTTTFQYATKQYVDSVTAQGAATATEAIGGISELATNAEQAASTDNGVTKPLVLQAKNASSSVTDLTNNYVVVTESDSNINQNFLDLTETWIFSGNFVVNNASSTITQLNINNATTSQLYIGTGNPSGVFGSQDLFVSGGATTTGSIHYTELCDSTNSCETSIGGAKMATSSATGIVSVVNTEATVKDIVITGGSVGKKGVIVIKGRGRIDNNNASPTSPELHLSQTDGTDICVLAIQVIATSADSDFMFEFTITADNSESAQHNSGIMWLEQDYTAGSGDGQDEVQLCDGGTTIDLTSDYSYDIELKTENTDTTMFLEEFYSYIIKFD